MADSWLVQMMPHMHLRGKDMTYTLTYPDGRKQVVLSVPKYDFNWQMVYQPAEPIFVPKGTRSASTRTTTTRRGTSSTRTRTARSIRAA